MKTIVDRVFGMALEIYKLNNGQTRAIIYFTEHVHIPERKLLKITVELVEESEEENGKETEKDN